MPESSVKKLLLQLDTSPLPSVFDRVVAIGNHASASLTKRNVTHEKVRHPSLGGKNLFVAGMARVAVR